MESIVKEKNKLINKIFYIYKGMLKYLTNNIYNIDYKMQNRKESKLFICPFKDCKKSYSLKNILLSHLRIHYGIKPFVCTYCNKSFNEKGNLKTHIRIHTGERPFKCKKCKKGFKALGQLKDHLISHTGYKPFQCPHCKKYYRRKEILKNHIIIHSKETFFKNNQEKFQEMLNEVKQMKHIKYNLDDLDSISKSNSNNDNSITFLSSSSLLKEEVKQNNISTNLSSNNLNDEKDKNIDNNNFIEKTKNDNLLGKHFLNFNKINNEFLLNDKLFKHCCNIWPNEINNILSSTDDISIKDENNIDIEKENFNIAKNVFEKCGKENDFCCKDIKSKSLYLYFDGNNMVSKNKFENDECSYMTHLTNLYYSEYEQKKDIDDFVNKF